MKRTKTVTVEQIICDICWRGEANPWNPCWSCGAVVCDSRDCSGLYMAGIGECDGYRICARCAVDGAATKALVATGSLREEHAMKSFDLRQEYSDKIAEIWQAFKEERKHAND